MLTVNQVAARLSVSRRTIFRLIADGNLSVVRIGGATRIVESDLDHFIEQRTQKGRVGEDSDGRSGD